MEELHDQEVAAHHAQLQRERGGHHPGHLPDPMAGVSEEANLPPKTRRQRSSGRASSANRRAAPPAERASTSNGNGGPLQLPLDAPLAADASWEPEG